MGPKLLCVQVQILSLRIVFKPIMQRIFTLNLGMWKVCQAHAFVGDFLEYYFEYNIKEEYRHIPHISSYFVLIT